MLRYINIPRGTMLRSERNHQIETTYIPAERHNGNIYTCLEAQG